MKNIISFIGSLLLVFTLLGCEDVLEVDIKSEIVAEGFPANGEEARALLIGSYRDLKEDINETVFSIDRSEAFDVGKIGTVSEAWAANLNAGNGPNWLGFYSALYNINFLLAQVDDLSFRTEAVAAQTKAEALFLRAFYYFYMTRIWGDVPLVLEPIRSAEAELLARTPAEQVMAQINADVEEALALFPTDGFTDKNFASKPAAYALLADVKMWSGKVLGGGTADFDVALSAIEMIENTGIGLIQDDFASIFRADNKKNVEIIFALYNSRDESVSHYASQSTPRTDIDFNSELSPWVPSSPSFGARHNYAPSQRIRQLFTNPSDIRRDITFVPMLQADGDDSNTEPDTSSFSQNKFRGEVFDGIRQYTDDIIIYRWADMLLLLAEAYAAKNDIPNALVALNRVRNRANIGDYAGPTDQSSVNRAILDERGRELFLELKRWWDLRRFHADGTIDVYEFVPNLVGKTIPLYWPVEQSVIAQNPIIEQTPGY
jgi:hypothetical protein